MALTIDRKHFVAILQTVDLSLSRDIDISIEHDEIFEELVVSVCKDDSSEVKVITIPV